MFRLGVHHRQRPTAGIDGEVRKLRPLRVVPNVYALASERPRRVRDVSDDATWARFGDEVVRLGAPHRSRVGSAPPAAPAAPFLRLRLAFVPAHPRVDASARVLCERGCRRAVAQLSGRLGGKPDHRETGRSSLPEKTRSLRASKPSRGTRRGETDEDDGVRRHGGGACVVDAADFVERGIRAPCLASGDLVPSGHGWEKSKPRRNLDR